MKQMWGRLLALLFIFLVAPFVAWGQGPTISSLSVYSGAIGTPVTINGSGFGSSQGTSTVTFRGVTATPTSWSSTSISTTAPAGLPVGPATVIVTVNQINSNGYSFTVYPGINSVSPAAGPIDSIITIAGTNFGTTAGTVTFNNYGAVIDSWSNTSVVAVVPPAATTGPLLVNNPSGYQSNSVTFTVTSGILYITPVSGPVGTPVSINGSLFGYSQGSNTVTFNGISTTPTVWGNNTIVAPVPTGATTGPIVVTIGGTPTNGVTFTVGPQISSLSPTTGSTSANVTITGTNFGASQGSSLVTFNGVPTTPSSWSSTSIVAPVPAGATTGPVAVTVGQVPSNAITFTVPPTISSLSPPSGPIGSSLVISGTSFGSTLGLTGSVTFNGIQATPNSWGPTKIVTTVPAGATTGPVVVNVDGTIPSNGVTFTVGSGTLAGTITNSGNPVNGASVQALQSNVVQASTSTGSNGTYSLANLIPGTYDIRVTATGLGTLIQAGNSVTAGNTTTVNIALSSQGTDSGTVTSGSTAINGATVTVFQGTDTVSSTTTNSSGTFSISTLSAGTYTVQASAIGFGILNQTGVVVTAGHTTTTNFNLSGQPTITYVYDELGRLVGAENSLSNAATYNYDPVGNLLSIANNPVSQVSVIEFTPKSGPIGTQVTINGTAFSATSSQDTVKFNGTSGTVNSSATVTQLVATVPSGATTGPISVTSPSGSATSTGSFTVTTAGLGTPTVTSFSPTIGTPSTAVTISGTNFDIASNDRTKFNVGFATIGSATSTSISTTVPVTATSGRVSVTTPQGSGTSSSDFFVPPSPYTPSSVGFTGRVSVGGSYTGTISTAGDIGLVLFDATAGQHVAIDTSNVTISDAAVSILSPLGATLVTTSIGTAGGLVSANVTMPMTGTYTILVAPYSSYTGSITLNVSSVLLDTIVESGPPVTVSLGSYQAASLTFPGIAGQEVSLLVSNVTANGYLYFYKPDGTAIFSQVLVQSTGYFEVFQSLPETGTYMLFYYLTGSGSGNATFNLYNIVNVTGSVTVNGSSLPVTLNAPGQTGAITFSGTANQKVTVHITSNTFNSNYGVSVALLDPNNNTLTSVTDLTSTSYNLQQQTLSLTGTYTISITPSNSNTGSLSINVTSP